VKQKKKFDNIDTREELESCGANGNLEDFDDEASGGLFN